MSALGMVWLSLDATRCIMSVMDGFVRGCFDLRVPQCVAMSMSCVSVRECVCMCECVFPAYIVFWGKVGAFRSRD